MVLEHPEAVNRVPPDANSAEASVPVESPAVPLPTFTCPAAALESDVSNAAAKLVAQPSTDVGKICKPVARESVTDAPCLQVIKPPVPSVVSPVPVCPINVKLGVEQLEVNGAITLLLRLAVPTAPDWTICVLCEAPNKLVLPAITKGAAIVSKRVKLTVAPTESFGNA